MRDWPNLTSHGLLLLVFSICSNVALIAKQVWSPLGDLRVRIQAPVDLSKVLQDTPDPVIPVLGFYQGKWNQHT